MSVVPPQNGHGPQFANIAYHGPASDIIGQRRALVLPYSVNSISIFLVADLIAGARGWRKPTGVQMKTVKECRIECAGNDIFVVADGVKIAKRRHPGTLLQPGTWISLEPGWTVLDAGDGTEIEISYTSVRIH